MLCNSLPYRLDSLEIDQCLGIDHAHLQSLPPNNQWVFITGQEDLTSLLKGLALAYYNDRLDAPSPPGCSDRGKIKLGLVHEDRVLPRLDYTYAIHKRFQGMASYRARNQAYLLGYGSDRQGHAPTFAGATQLRATATVGHLFGGHVAHPQLTHELLRAYLESPDRFARLRDLLVRTWPQLQDIAVRGREVRFIFADGRSLRWEELGVGPRGLLTMVGDIYLCLAQQQGGDRVPEELMGIVLIDEPEVHLPPAYRRSFTALFGQAFPRLQFVVATHSPILLTGATKDAVFLHLERSPQSSSLSLSLQRLDIYSDELSADDILASPLFDLRSMPEPQQPGPGGAETYDWDKVIEGELDRRSVGSDATPLGRLFGGH